MKRVLVISCLILLVLACVLSNPSPVHAEGVVASGTFTDASGNELIWIIDSKGVLTFSGEGTLVRSGYGQFPWFKYKDSVVSIKIEEGITAIGDKAFFMCAATSVSLPTSLTSIGEGAFNGCKGLRSVTIPDSVTSIGPFAFYLCTELTSVTIGKHVVAIDEGAFEGCSKLTSVIIPNSTRVIESQAFAGCKELTSVTIGEGVTSIGEGAFGGCIGLKLVNYNAKNVLDLKYNSHVFVNTGKEGDGLTIIFGDTVEYIPAYLFYSDYSSDKPRITKVRFFGNMPTFGLNCFRDLSFTGYFPYGNNTWNDKSDFIGNSDYVNWVTYSLGEPASAEVVQMPYITKFEKGSDPDFTGLALNIIFTDGFVERHELSDLEIINYDFSKPGKRPVAVSYKGLPFVFDVTVVEMVDTLIDSSEYPQSSHPYDNNMDEMYTYSYPGAEKIEFTFSENTSLNDDSDYLYVYDGDDNLVATYTKKQAAGQTVTIPGDSFKIKLTSNESSSEYGFSIDSIVVTEAVGSCENGHTYNVDVEYVWAADYSSVSAGHVCIYCGEIDVIENAPSTSTSTATCLEDGTTTFTSVFENTALESQIKTMQAPALGHDLIHHDAKAATCTEVGWDAYDTCSRCDYTTYAEIPAFGHDLVNHYAKAATCTEVGWNAYDACSRCDYTTYSEIAALDHNLAHHDAKAATCTEVGWNAYDTCSRCDYTTYSEIAALGHDLAHHDAKAATCTEIGWNAYDTCSRCDYTTYFEIAALGHDLAHHDAKAATCTEVGWNAYDTCSRCDYTTYVEIPATGHHLAAHVANAPTCTTAGNSAYWSCDSCEKFFSNESGTDEIAGSSWMINALGHDWGEWSVIKAATEDEEGLERRVCSRDGSHIEERIIPTLVHVHELVKTNSTQPSCMTAGNKEYWTCSKCGRFYADAEGTNEIEKDSWVITALGHDLIHHDAKAATCTEVGWNEYDTCRRCDYTTFSDIAALGHDIVHHDAKAAACTEAGWEAYDTCSRCDYTTKVDIQALGHGWLEPSWIWADDYTTACAVFACGLCTEEARCDADININGETYTAKVTGPDGKEYTDTKVVKPDTFVLGDVTGDGEVTADDLTRLSRHVARIDEFDDADLLKAADVTGDGQVTADDLTMLSRYVAKIITSLDGTESTIYQIKESDYYGTWVDYNYPCMNENETLQHDIYEDGRWLEYIAYNGKYPEIPPYQAQWTLDAGSWRFENGSYVLSAYGVDTYYYLYNYPDDPNLIYDEDIPEDKLIPYDGIHEPVLTHKTVDSEGNTVLRGIWIKHKLSIEDFAGRWNAYDCIDGNAIAYAESFYGPGVGDSVIGYECYTEIKSDGTWIQAGATSATGGICRVVDDHLVLFDTQGKEEMYVCYLYSRPDDLCNIEQSSLTPYHNGRAPLLLKKSVYSINGHTIGGDSYLVTSGTIIREDYFSINEMAIKLTNSFERYDSNIGNCDCILLSEDTEVDITRYSKNMYSAGTSLTDFARIVHTNCSKYNPGNIINNDKYNFFTVDAVNPNDKLEYRHVMCMYESNNAFWLVEFSCQKSKYDLLENWIFNEWADSVWFME